ncbi:hypothetical protein MKX01_018365 [Papaver californicum]|nr:hypothetical protein MKX01_018365 [Papaver californicum]
MSGKEKRAQEKIAELSAEVKKKEGDGKVEYVKLKEAYADLERRKQSAEEEIRILRKSVADLKNQASSRLTCEVESQKNLDDCKFQCNQLSLKLEEKNREFLASEVKLKDLTSRNNFVVYELNEYKKASDVLKERISQLEEDLKAIFETKKQAQEKIIHISEELKKAGEDTEVWKEMCGEMKKESEAYKCKCGELCLNLEENKRKSGKYDVIYERETVVQQSITKLFEEIRILEREKPDLIKTYTSDSNCSQSEVSHKDEENKDNSHMAVTGVSSVTMMCNTLTNVESEKNIPIEIELDGIIDISDSKDELPPSGKRLKRPLPGQRCDKNWINLEDSSLSSITKRKWVSATGSSEQGIEDDIIMKKFNAGKDENPKHFSLRMCSRIPNASFGGQHVEENKCSTEGKTLYHLQMSGGLHEKVGNTTFMGDTENVLEDVRSNGESENFGAYMVKGDLHLNDNQIQLIQDNGSSWKSEAHMLSSFEEDPELYMKAVCALCRQQTLKEKYKQDPLGYYMKRGFHPFHAYRGTEVAVFLMDGDREGDLKKSIEELYLFDRKALEDCKALARTHSNQLFGIYTAEEDPFFRPSSAN